MSWWPDGTAVNGTAEDGTAEDGTAEDDTAEDCTAEDGTVEDGTAVDGPAEDGMAVDGPAEDDTAVDGTAVDATAVDATAEVYKKGFLAFWIFVKNLCKNYHKLDMSSFFLLDNDSLFQLFWALRSSVTLRDEVKWYVIYTDVLFIFITLP